MMLMTTMPITTPMMTMAAVMVMMIVMQLPQSSLTQKWKFKFMRALAYNRSQSLRSNLECQRVKFIRSHTQILPGGLFHCDGVGIAIARRPIVSLAGPNLAT